MLTTWKGDPELKCSVVTNLIRHREADNFIFGDYARMGMSGPLSFKGCALGCTLVPFNASLSDLAEIKTWVGTFKNKEWAKATASRYGLPIWLARLEEAVFESNAGDEDWPVEFASAIPVGVPYRELKLRVQDELKRRIKKRGTRAFAGMASGIEDHWWEEGWDALRVVLLELLRGVKVDIPQLTADQCPALEAIAS